MSRLVMSRLEKSHLRPGLRLIVADAAALLAALAVLTVIAGTRPRTSVAVEAVLPIRCAVAVLSQRSDDDVSMTLRICHWRSKKSRLFRASESRHISLTTQSGDLYAPEPDGMAPRSLY